MCYLMRKLKQHLIPFIKMIYRQLYEMDATQLDRISVMRCTQRWIYLYMTRFAIEIYPYCLIVIDYKLTKACRILPAICLT